MRLIGWGSDHLLHSLMQRDNLEKRADNLQPMCPPSRCGFYQANPSNKDSIPVFFAKSASVKKSV